MTLEQKRVAEAVASLSARLAGWGVEEPTLKAEQYVRDMIRAGWRASAPAVPDLSHMPEHQPVPEDFKAARARLAAERMTTTPAPHSRGDGQTKEEL